MSELFRITEPSHPSLQASLLRLPDDNFRPAAISLSPSRADIARRGFAISFLTLASVASPNSFLAFFFIEHP
jgi:hypothetical protein